jgi:hypothetical protein
MAQSRKTKEENKGTKQTCQIRVQTDDPVFPSHGRVGKKGIVEYCWVGTSILIYQPSEGKKNLI